MRGPLCRPPKLMCWITAVRRCAFVWTDGNRTAPNGVIYAQMGQRIIDAALSPAAIELIEINQTMLGEATDLTWHDVSIDLWVPLGGLIDDVQPLWAYGVKMHTASCSTCHSLHEADEHLANQWIGIVNAMERFIALDKEESRLLQRYLQRHASDIEEDEH